MAMAWYWQSGADWVAYEDKICCQLEREYEKFGQKLKHKITLGDSTERFIVWRGGRGGWVQERGDNPSQWRAVKRGDDGDVPIEIEDSADDEEVEDSPNAQLKQLHDERVARHGSPDDRGTKRSGAPEGDDPPWSGSSPPKRSKREKDITMRPQTSEERQFFFQLQTMKDAGVDDTRKLMLEMGSEGTKEWTVRRKGTAVHCTACLPACLPLRIATPGATRPNGRARPE